MTIEDFRAHGYAPGADAPIAALSVTGTKIAGALEALEHASADPPELAPAA